MTMFTIFYQPTGRHSSVRDVTIFSCDEKRDGTRINDIIGAIERFEEIAEDNWKSYESRNAIVKIECKEV